MSSIPVTEPQYLAIANAAAALCPSDRDQFISRVYGELQGHLIGDGTIGRASASCKRASRNPKLTVNHTSDHAHVPS